MKSHVTTDPTQEEKERSLYITRVMSLAFTLWHFQFLFIPQNMKFFFAFFSEIEPIYLFSRFVTLDYGFFQLTVSPLTRSRS